MKPSVELQAAAVALHQKTVDARNHAKRELALLESQVAILNAKIEIHGKRESRFPALLNELQHVQVCPDCWINDGEARELIPQSSDNDLEDVLRCSRCKREFLVEVP